ncbi:MAG: thioredoxin family protein [Bacilli bacterium]|nr:thioredoxin family protein [Bacilli bacterium]MDD4808710.1 thioredoxin family protein [Bacilli bacterium]
MEKRSNEIKKTYFLLGLIIVITFLIIISSINFNNNLKNETVQNILDRDGMSLVFLGNNSSLSSELEPNLDYLKNQYNFTYDRIDTALYDQTELNKVLKSFDIDQEDFGAPVLIIVEDGKILDRQIGDMKEEELFNYLKETQIISSEAIYEAKSSGNDIKGVVNYIGYDAFETLNSGDKAFILVIGQTGCGYCTKYLSVLNQLVNENNVEVNYLDVQKITDQDYKDLIASIDYFKNSSRWGTPLTLIINNKKTIDYISGYVEIESLKEFLKKKFL